MKRTIALFLASILCLTACGKGPEHSPQVSQTGSAVEQGDPEPSRVYVDRQGTDAVYSSLSMTQNDNGYVIEMEIYRLGSFRGTAVETQGMLVYTDDFIDLQGTIQYDLDHAVFVVTESSSDLVEVGTTWVFPEMLEG